MSSPNIPNMGPLFDLAGTYYVDISQNNLEFDDLQLQQPVMFNDPMREFYYQSQGKVNDPVTMEVIEGRTAELRVDVGGTGLNYVWTLGGTPVSNGAAFSGQGTATLTILDMSSGEEGTYTCDVTNNNWPGLIIQREDIVVTMSTFDLDSSVPAWYISVETVSNQMHNNIIIPDFTEAGLSAIKVFSNTNNDDYATLVGEIALTGAVDGYNLVDLSSDPSARAYSYKIAVMDDLIPTMSAKSNMQQSVHLTINLGLNDARNMIWTEYLSADLTVVTYDVMGGNSMDVGTMFTLATLPAGFTTYTDYNEYAYYAILTNFLGFPGAMKSDGIFQSKSNIFATNGIPDIPSTNDLWIYPNPVNDKATLSFENPDNLSYTLKVTDISGRVWKTQENITGNKFTFQVADLPAGIYIIELIGINNYISKMLID